MSFESPVHSPSIFLSHAHEDKPFVRRLAGDLSSAGVRVWVDEAEIGVGDSLLDKITFAISEMDYLGVVISASSEHSEWVTREVEVAMSDEIAGKRVKVIPLVLRGGALPPVLAGKVFGDFTSEPAYPGSLQRLLARLGIESTSPSTAAGRLSELTSSSALLAAALAELRSTGLSDSTAEALVSSKVADVELSEFLALAAEETSGSEQLLGLAISLVQYIDERGVGQRALDICLRPGRMEDRYIPIVAERMSRVKSTAAVLWCHSRLVSVIKSDVYYHSFLRRHIDTVLDRCYDEMAAYLLQPNRGPGNYNLDSFEEILSRVDNPVPFQSRLRDWINGHYFDLEGHDRLEGWEGPDILYKMLNDHWGEPVFDEIARVIRNHVYHLIRKRRIPEDPVTPGLFHLVAMVDARYRGADWVLDEILPRVWDVPPMGVPVLRLVSLVTKSIGAVVDYNQEPSNEHLERIVDEYFHEIQDADESGITGFWRPRLPPDRSIKETSKEHDKRKSTDWQVDLISRSRAKAVFRLYSGSRQHFIEFKKGSWGDDVISVDRKPVLKEIELQRATIPIADEYEQIQVKFELTKGYVSGIAQVILQMGTLGIVKRIGPVRITVDDVVVYED
jgi:hypothetical protein